MKSNIAMITNATGLTVVLNGKIYTIANDHPQFDAIRLAHANGDADEIERMVSIRKTIEQFGAGIVTIKNGSLFYGDREMKNGLAKRIIKMMNEGREAFAKPLIAFMENVMLNPSFRAVEGLYEWLERSNLPITPDGHFLAWKIVNRDYKDIRTNTFDNSPGAIVEIPRNQVNEDPNQTCSSGLHFCSNEYLPKYGGFYGGSNSRIMLVKVNPRDVGAFPYDYNISKSRCCRYEVLQEVTETQVETLFEDTNSGVYNPAPKAKPKAKAHKTVARLDTRTDRAVITLVFTDGTEQKTSNRLGDTTTWEQHGDFVTLFPSERTITIE